MSIFFVFFCSVRCGSQNCCGMQKLRDQLRHHNSRDPFVSKTSRAQSPSPAQLEYPIKKVVFWWRNLYGSRLKARAGLPSASCAPCCSSADPYHRPGPVHTCLNVRVRETGDWDLFSIQIFFSPKIDLNLFKNTKLARVAPVKHIKNTKFVHKSEWARAVERRVASIHWFAKKMLSTKFRVDRDWFRVARLLLLNPCHFPLLSPLIGEVRDWWADRGDTVSWQRRFPGSTRAIFTPASLGFPLTIFNKKTTLKAQIRRTVFCIAFLANRGVILNHRFPQWIKSQCGLFCVFCGLFCVGYCNFATCGNEQNLCRCRTQQFSHAYHFNV